MFYLFTVFIFIICLLCYYYFYLHGRRIDQTSCCKPTHCKTILFWIENQRLIMDDLIHACTNRSCPRATAGQGIVYTICVLLAYYFFLEVCRVPQ